MARVRTPHRRYTEDEKAAIFRLRDQGMSFAEIGRQLGRDEGALRVWHREHSAKAIQPALRVATPAPVAASSGFIKPPSLAQLMAGR